MLAVAECSFASSSSRQAANSTCRPSGAAYRLASGASTLRLADAAWASARETRNDSIGRRRRSVGAGVPPFSISRVPEPEWQQSRITATVRPLGRNFVDQLGDLLVGEVPASRSGYRRVRASRRGGPARSSRTLRVPVPASHARCNRKSRRRPLAFPRCCGTHR